MAEVVIEFGVHSSDTPRGFAVHSLTDAVESAEAMWRENQGPITVVIDLMVIRYGRILSQRSVYWFERNTAWPG
jgi:hypothetical protein